MAAIINPSHVTFYNPPLISRLTVRLFKRWTIRIEIEDAKAGWIPERIKHWITNDPNVTVIHN